MDKDRKHDILYTKVDVKVYIQDKQHVGFWKAVNDDSWKTGCVVTDQMTELTSIKVFAYVFIAKYLICFVKYIFRSHMYHLNLNTFVLKFTRSMKLMTITPVGSYLYHKPLLINKNFQLCIQLQMMNTS